MDVDPLLKKHNFGQILTVCETSSDIISLHDITLLTNTVIQQMTSSVMMQPWLSGIKLYGLLKVYKSLRMQIDSRSNIASACGHGRGCNISESTALWCSPPLRSSLRTMDGYQRCADSGILVSYPICICSLASAIMSLSPRILNLHLLKKLSDVHSIHARVGVRASPSSSSS